jgi:dUTP pyrophosphatase
MKVKVVKTEENAILPKYQTSGAAGFDFHSLNSVNIPAGSTIKLRTGIAMQIPEGYELQIRPRSGVSAKTKIRIANAPGTIDSDYTGEIMIIIDNISQNQADSFRINQGDRIAQGVLKQVERAEFEVVGELDDTDRGSGGFGSTGN